MREIDVSEVAAEIRRVVQELNVHTPETTLSQLVRIQGDEPSEAGRQAMDQIVENRRIASERGIPMCQDTGMVVVFAEVGQEVHFTGGGFTEAVTRGVREGYEEAFLRDSVVEEPLFERRNTGDNTPPVIHTELVPGDALRLRVGAKGFGAENMSWARVLPPATGLEGVRDEVVRCVVEAGPNACPPVVVGVGVGGTLEMATLLAKKSLMREPGRRHDESRYAELEEELLERINATGIGPQGWGGENTALDVRVEYYPTHIAAIPLAVNLDCHLQRHARIEL